MTMKPEDRVRHIGLSIDLATGKVQLSASVEGVFMEGGAVVAVKPNSAEGVSLEMTESDPAVKSLIEVVMRQHGVQVADAAKRAAVEAEQAKTHAGNAAVAATAAEERAAQARTRASKK